ASRRPLATTLRVRCRTKKRPAASKSPRFGLMPPLSAKEVRMALRLPAPVFTVTTTAPKPRGKPARWVLVLQLQRTKTWRPTPRSYLGRARRRDSRVHRTKRQGPFSHHHLCQPIRFRKGCDSTQLLIAVSC